jgi:hypothetical protein
VGSNLFSRHYVFDSTIDRMLDMVLEIVHGRLVDVLQDYNHILSFDCLLVQNLRYACVSWQMGQRLEYLVVSF